MKKDNLYIHISTAALPQYFLAGCIKPTNFLHNRPEDIQSKFPNEILLCSKMWSENNDCSIQVILKDEELKNANQHGEFLLYAGIIPISRITSIFGTNKEVAEQVIWNIDDGAGFVAKHLMHYVTRAEEETLSAINIKSHLVEMKQTHLTKISDAFNRALGGMAFLRVALNDINDANINYPINYLPTASFFSSSLEREISKNGINTNSDLHSLFNGKSTFSKFLTKTISDDLLIQSAAEEKIELEERFGNYKLDNIPEGSNTFNIALLNTYGKNKSKSVEDLLSTFFTNLNFEQREETALIFGIKNGYDSLRNFYKINNRKVLVKFEMNSKLDYVIVESIYHYVTSNHQKATNLDHLQGIFDKLPKQDNVWHQGYVNYRIFNSVITTKIKDYSEHLDSLLSLIIKEITSWFPFKISETQLGTKFKSLIKKKFKTIVDQIKIELQEDLKVINDAQASKDKQSEASALLKPDSKKEVVLKDQNQLHKENVNKTINQTELNLNEGNQIQQQNLIDKEEKNANELEGNSTSDPKVDENIAEQIESEDELKRMNLPRLRQMAEYKGIKFSAKVGKAALIGKILSFEKSKTNN